MLNSLSICKGKRHLNFWFLRIKLLINDDFYWGCGYSSGAEHFSIIHEALGSFSNNTKQTENLPKLKELLLLLENLRQN